MDAEAILRRTDANARLAEAVKAGDVERAREALREGADPNQAPPDGSWKNMFALAWAAHHGQLAMCQALIDAGAWIDAFAPNGPSALTSASARGEAACVALLLRAGADPNATSNEGMLGGWTALTSACAGGCEAVVRMLVGAGADMETRLVSTGQLAGVYPGWSPAFVAAAGGQIECLRALIELGCAIDAKDDAGAGIAAAARAGRMGRTTSEVQERRELCACLAEAEPSRREARAIEERLGQAGEPEAGPKRL